MELAKIQKLLGNHSAAKYRAALLALLPDGRLWEAERDNPKGELYRLCGIWASEYALLEQTLYSLHSETGPISTANLKPWLEATGTSALEHSELTQRIRALIALIGSQASTAQSFASIATQLGYKATLVHRGAKKAGKKTARLGSVRFGQRMWPAGSAKTLELKSRKPAFRALATEIAAEKVARCGSVRFGQRLWPNTSAIHNTIAAKATHKQIKSECEIIEGLLPAHLRIETRYLN